MKNLFLKILAAVTLLAALPQARAWTYNDGDVLLIFRKNSQDIEFNLGSVTSYLGKTNGYTTNVTNWSLSLVTSTFGSLTGAKVALIAATDATNWLSSAEPNTTAYNVSASDFDLQHGVIAAVGNGPLYPYPIATSGANSYSIDASPSGQYKSRAYDYIVTGGGVNSGIAQLGGNAPFTVEKLVPGRLLFWQIQPSAVYPNPPADKLIGSFNITTNGVLTFVAGPVAPTITGITRSGNTNTVTFTTTVGNTYSLLYTNKLGGATSTWIPDATTITGSGGPSSISRTTSSAVEFYKVKAQ